MTTPYPDSENALESEAIALFQQLGWQTLNCYDEKIGNNNPLGRKSRKEIVLIPQLHQALTRLNPELPEIALQSAIDNITLPRHTLSLENANREIYKLLKEGIKVKYQNQDNQEEIDTVKIIDWHNPHNNNFFLASQLWLEGEIYTRRADLIGFINGLPLVFIELKSHHNRLEKAYHDNLRDYKNTIPQLFWYNGLIILSNGSKSRIGSITSPFEHFSEWKKINSEGETGIISLDTIIRGTCQPEYLLDIIENFTVFKTEKGKMIKIVAKNHQFLGVNNAIEAVNNISTNQGKLGVFWHTQGSGKSYSMVFFAQKILRKLTGNWTFLIITDREDLDKQIYQNFAYTEAVTESQENVKANSAQHLQQLLTEDHRYIFTLIQKFRTKKGENYPELSTRSDIIVIADEAHRSQYDTFALNMRKALPNACFIGFTGTPLIVGEEKTREVFGDYVSIYNFRQSIEDGATVPLYYENRIPELQLTNEQLNEEMQDIIDNAMLDEEAEKLLQSQCTREYNLIINPNRLDKIARDIVTHFLGRGYQEKAMVISIDRFTTVKMYDLVQKYWQEDLTQLQQKIRQPNLSEFEIKRISKQIKYMEETDMAVVISSSQNEVEDFREKGLDITRHRQRLADKSQPLDEQFKDANNPLRIVFVCAMWITGFDAPSCAIVYLDKPMKNHTLMQTIARANRVFKDKVNGLIVDYIGVFRNLKDALAIYGSASGGGVDEGDNPVLAKTALIEKLREVSQESIAFCRKIGINLESLTTIQKTAFEKVKVWEDAIEAILINEETLKTFFAHCNNVTRLYKAILPDTTASEFAPTQQILERLRLKIKQEIPQIDISETKTEIEELLAESIVAGEFIIPSTPRQLIDLSQLDLNQLETEFQQGQRKNTQTERLKALVERKVREMLTVNKTRLNYYEKYQQMIQDYNSGSHNVEWLFNQLMELAQELNEEEKRAVGEKLTEEELAIFDLLTKPNINLSQEEEKNVKQIVRELLTILKREKLVIDWRKRQQTRASVETTIKDILDRLPESYSAEIYKQKCNQVYQYIYDFNVSKSNINQRAK